MDAERQRIEEDLRGQLAGDVHCDDLYVQLYASDASIYEIAPLGVVRPRTVDDVVATVRYAAEHGISLHPRGSGSGLAGGAIGSGLIVDFSRYFRRILETTEETVRVQSGVILSHLNAHLAKQNRLFGPDPAMRNVTTMGSAVALDASGSHWPRYGSVRRHVQSMEVVLASGEVARLESHPIPSVDSNRIDPLSPLLVGLNDILQQNAQLIRDHQPQSCVNCSGYQLRGFDPENGDPENGDPENGDPENGDPENGDSENGDLVNGDSVNGLDLARLITGSEGTLALVTEVSLSTDPLPLHTGSALLFFDSLDKAAHGAVELGTHPLASHHPVACDLMDRRHLSLARESDPRYELLIPQAAEAVLLVELHAESAEDLRSQLDESCQRLQHQSKLASSCYVASDPIDNEFLWQLAQRFVPTLYRLKGSTRPIPFVEDIAIPPESLPGFFQRLQTTLKKQQITASVFGHAMHGQLHIRPFLDLANADDLGKMESLAEELYAHVWDLKGTISGEHGDGLSRTPFVGKQVGPLAGVFRQVKQLFDPQGILNPGKIVPTAERRLTDNLRHITYPLLDTLALTGKSTTASQNVLLSTSIEQTEPTAGLGPPTGLIDLQLDWQPEEMAYAARACNGCSACRSQQADVRMCPIFRFAPREEASPRAKANLARGILTGALPAGTVFDDSCKEIADLCVHCHMCRLECPANVDIPKLMLEAKAAHLATNGQGLHEWILTRVDSLASIASRLSRVANWALANRIARWLIEKSMGIAQGRKLPRFARQPFLQIAIRRRLHRPLRYSLPKGHPSKGHSAKANGSEIGRAEREHPEKVLYFVDTYANYCDTELAESLVAVLEHNGISVYVPETQRYAGMPMISQGMTEPARQIAEENVALLAEAVRQGYTIISTEPTAVLALTHEYPMLLDGDHDAELVAANTMEACHYLWRWHQQGKLQLDFAPLPVAVGYHAPCHQKALEIGSPSENLLGLIPGLQIERLEKGCCGMAGMYGIKRKNYRNSLRAGLPLLTAIRAGSFQVGVTECSTCKLQMEQGTSKAAIHPIKLVALAYGLKPEFRQLLNRPTEELVVT